MQVENAAVALKQVTAFQDYVHGKKHQEPIAHRRVIGKSTVTIVVFGFAGAYLLASG